MAHCLFLLIKFYFHIVMPIGSYNCLWLLFVLCTMAELSSRDENCVAAKSLKDLLSSPLQKVC